jgi:Peptidase_C39 like family
MERLQLEILAQPDDMSCGATCLQAIYRHHGDRVSLEEVIRDVEKLEEGGTLGVMLGCHALKRGYRVSLYSYNLQVFDPTWRTLAPSEMIERLAKQMAVKHQRKMKIASRAYMEFMRLGGDIRLTELSPKLIRRHLARNVPVIAGLSSTFLYQTPREYGPLSEYDDVRGVPGGHFVVLCGYDMESRDVLVADPYQPNPAKERYYAVGVNRLICSILLGVLTYDANLLVITPARKRR